MDNIKRFRDYIIVGALIFLYFIIVWNKSNNGQYDDDYYMSYNYEYDCGYNDGYEAGLHDGYSDCRSDYWQENEDGDRRPIYPLLSEVEQKEFENYINKYINTHGYKKTRQMLDKKYNYFLEIYWEIDFDDYFDD